MKLENGIALFFFEHIIISSEFIWLSNVVFQSFLQYPLVLMVVC